MKPQVPSRLEGLSRLLTVLVTNVIKIAGVYVGVKGAAQPTPSVVVLAFAGFMIAGGQVSEGVLLGIIERFFSIQRNAGE